MKKRIYLAGAMSGLKWSEMFDWRNTIRCSELYNDFIIINPCIMYPEIITEEVEKESMLWDLYQVRQADILVVDFSHPNSIGTTWELAIASEKHIPIIGVYTSGKSDIHPWWRMATSYICNDIEELIDYISTYYGE